MMVLELSIKEPLSFRLITEILVDEIIWCLGIVSKYYGSGKNKWRCGWAGDVYVGLQDTNLSTFMYVWNIPL